MFNITTQTLFMQAALLAFCFALACLFASLGREFWLKTSAPEGKPVSTSERILVSLTALFTFASLILATAVLLGI